MELQLGLGLSSSSSSSCHESSAKTNKGFDLLSNGVKDLFGSVPDDHFKKRKRFADQHSGFPFPQTLPLLVWTKFDNKNQEEEEEEGEEEEEEDDDGNEVQSNSIFVHHKNDEENGVIGWPPVKSCRKKVCQLKNRRWKSMYVKVQMEGVGIARKVDLNLHTSYQRLVVTLANMFGKSPDQVKLTYQDKEGDWLLAGDVPWRSFVETVQRLKLLRNNCG